jgi:hypothetical protein
VQTNLCSGAGYVGTKVGYRQAPHKQQSPPREGFVVYALAFVVTDVGMKTRLPITRDPCAALPERNPSHHLHKACFSAG